MNTVTVKINGVEYNLKGKENDKYLLAVADYVDGKFREISSNNNKLSTTAVAVLSALNITDEYFKCELNNEDLVKRKNSLEEKCATLKERLREVKTEYEESNQIKDEEVENLKNIICSMEDKLKEVDTLYSTIDDLKKELELAKEKLQVKSKALKDKYEMDKQELRNGFNKEKETLTVSFNKNMSELKNTLKGKEEKINRLNSRNQELQKVESSLKNELALKTKEVEENKCNREEVKQLEIKLTSIEKEKNSLRESFEKDICELNKSLEEKNSKINLLSSRNEELQKVESSLKNELVLKEKEVEENKCNREEINQLKIKVTSIEKEKDALRESFEKDICELNNSLEEKDEKITLLNLKNEELQKVEKSLKNELVLKEKEVEESIYNSDELKQLQSKIDTVEKEKDILKKYNKELKFKLQNSRYKLLDLEKKLNDANFSLAIEKKLKNPLLK